MGIRLWCWGGGVLRSSLSCPTSDALWPYHHFDSLTYKPLGWAIYKFKIIASSSSWGMDY